jgi:DNA-binding NtrC family response regulator
MKHTILVVDDEAGQRQFISGSLARGYRIVSAVNGLEASQLLSHRNFDLVITDERMPGMDGIELIRWIREHTPETPVVVLTAYGSVETAVEAIKLGAEEYLTKPLKSPEELRVVVEKVLSRRAMLDRNLLHQQETEAVFPQNVIAESESMRSIFKLADQVARQPSTVLLTGESGTGKEVVARFIHRRSLRKDSIFVPVNCAAITETLLESELFGHEKGSFTGATQTRRGRFELANGGTLFLDEVAEMGVSLQAKFLRVLQEQQFERIGSDRTIAVDVRVIAATNKELTQAIASKSFREDLYYRLSVFPIHIPQSGVIEKEDLPLKNETAASMLARPGLLAQVERTTILDALSRNNGDRRATSEELGISLRTLQYRLKEYGITGRD